MSLLRTLELKIEGLVEGTFGRVFRSEVRPIELARKLVREMDEHRTPSVSRVWVPHEYDVWLSVEDREHFEGIEREVIDELGAYLLEHARREELVLAGRPAIRFHTDEELELGEFGIEAQPPRLEEGARPEEPVAGGYEQPVAGGYEQPAAGQDDWLGEVEQARPPAGEPDAGHTMIYSGSQRLREPLERSRRTREAGASLVVGGTRLLLGPGGGVVGRSRDCDVVLDDSGVSRRHAQIRPGPGGWTIEDLGSTNGVLLGGRQIRGIEGLRDGDRIELGSTEIVFESR